MKNVVKMANLVKRMQPIFRLTVKNKDDRVVKKANCNIETQSQAAGK